jgi:hypothetical protein
LAGAGDRLRVELEILRFSDAQLGGLVLRSIPE